MFSITLNNQIYDNTVIVDEKKNEEQTFNPNRL
jgi:hypothetical protein